MDRLAGGIVLFGFGAGVALAIVSREPVSGATAFGAILLSGILLTAVGLGSREFLHLDPAYQAVTIMVLTFIGFAYWTAWINSPYLVTSDLRELSTVSQSTMTRFRLGLISLVAFYAFLLAWVFRQRNSAAPTDRSA